MVEGARLERVYTGNCIEGSNPSLSAISAQVPFFTPITVLMTVCPGRARCVRMDGHRFARLDVGGQSSRSSAAYRKVLAPNFGPGTFERRGRLLATGEMSGAVPHFFADQAGEWT